MLDDFHTSNTRSVMYKDYGLSKREWTKIKEDIISNELNNIQVKKKYDLNHNQVQFLYDKLLQEKYNHLYKREKLVNPQKGDFVYCDYEGFGRGVIAELHSGDLMSVKFDKRGLNTMCSSDSMVTVFDDLKRKITRI